MQRMKILALAACFSGLASISTALAQGDPRPEFRVGLEGISGTIDPGADHSNVGAQNWIPLFDSLIQRDHTSVEAVLEPALATSWEYVDEEETVLELKLREGVTFHNGMTMTAADVEYSIERILLGEHAPYESVRGQFFDSLERVDIVDDLTVRVVTKRHDPLLPILLSTTQLAIIPKAYMEEVGYDGFAQAPIGTGPFKLTEFVPETQMVLEAFDEFWGEQPNVSVATLRAIPELSSRITALVNGEVDLIDDVAPDQLETVKNAPCCELLANQAPIFHLIYFNAAETDHPIMEDKTFRQALGLAIDRQLLVDALWNGNAVLPPGHQYPQYGDLYMPDYPPAEYDLERAQELLEASSYNGETITFSTSSTYYTNGLLAAQVIAEMWNAIGVKTELLVDHNFEDQNTDFMVGNWSNPMYFPDPAGSYGVMWNPTGARVPIDWQPEAPNYTELYERFRFSRSVDVRREAYREIMDIAREEVPFTLLYQPIEYYGIRKGINWQPLPGHQPYGLDFRADNLSFEEQASR